jgi:hypothetical protein
MNSVHGGALAAVGVAALAIPLVAHLATRGHKAQQPTATVQHGSAAAPAHVAAPSPAHPPAAAPSLRAAAPTPDCGKRVKRDRYAVVVKKTTPTKEHDATKVITNRPPPRPCP